MNSYDRTNETARASADEVLAGNLTRAMLRKEVREAVREGISSAMTEEAAREFWSVGIAMLREQTTQRAGHFVLDGLWFALRRGFWIGLALAGVYALGGWQLLVTVWEAFVAKGHA